EFIRFAGFDAQIYVRMYSLAGKMLSVIALFALPVVLPVNCLGHFETTDNLLSKMSMSNVGVDSPWLWVHVTGIYVVTLVCLLFLKAEF
ncbi:unnamed protein product, partial [Ectocarpus sp. 12 AP-2014]